MIKSVHLKLSGYGEGILEFCWLSLQPGPCGDSKTCWTGVPPLGTSWSLPSGERGLSGCKMKKLDSLLR